MTQSVSDRLAPRRVSRLRLRAFLAPVAALAAGGALGIGGCGGGPSGSSRPATPARIQIVVPGPNEVSGPDVHLSINLIGAQVVQPNSGQVRPDQGHIHVSMDGQLVSMTYGTTQDLPNTPPGSHSIQAEFVAVDHQPFSNRVIASVLFTVQP